MSKRKQYTPQFKFDRAIEAIQKDSLTEVSRKYGIAINVLSKWRSELLEKGSQTFVMTPDKEKKQLKAKIAKLEQMLGKKEVELNVLKNFSDFYESENMT